MHTDKGIGTVFFHSETPNFSMPGHTEPNPPESVFIRVYPWC